MASKDGFALRSMDVVFLFGGGRVPKSREYGTGTTDDSADSDITFTGWTNYNPGK